MIVETPVQSRVVEAEELSDYLGAEDSPVDDALFTDVIRAVTDRAERFTNRAFLTRVCTETRRFTDWVRIFRFLRAPVTLVQSVKIDGEVVPDDQYELSNDALYFDPPQFANKGIEVVYEAGYSDSGRQVPDAIRVAILRGAATILEHREDVVVGTIATELPAIASALLAPYKRHLL